MKENSIKKFDDIGRIVIPPDIRNAQGWGNNSKITIHQAENGVLLKTYKNSCFACGNEDDIVPIHKKFICKKCIDELRD